MSRDLEIKMIPLTEEAEKLYFILFKKTIPDVIKSRYEQAAATIHLSFDDDEISACSSLINAVRDLEALEYAARFTRKYELLSKKLTLMVWLAGTLPENFCSFVNTKERRLFGWFVMIAAGFRSAWKLIKGFVLLKLRGGHA